MLAMAAIGGLAVVTHPKEPVTSPEAAVAPAPAVVNRTALSCPVLATGGKLTSVVNAVSPTLPEGTPTASGGRSGRWASCSKAECQKPDREGGQL